MMTLMLLTAATLYGLFARFVVRMVYADTGSKRSKWIAIAIFWLIPFGDVILGYPIYWYLCHYKAGVKIYRTVENVEGIYVGENDFVLLRRAMIPGEHRWSTGYSRYKYVDMRDRNSGKFFRLYRLNNNSDPACMNPGKYKYGSYAEFYNSGRCIARKEIPEDQVSRWGYYYYPFKKPKEYLKFPPITMDTPFMAVDRKYNKLLAVAVNYAWLPGWLSAMLTSIESGPHWKRCFRVTDDRFFIHYKIFKPILNQGGEKQ